MGLKPLVACLLLTSLAFAGCADNDDEGKGASSTSASTAPDLPPTGSISVTTPGGSLPLAANVTLTGSDPEQGNLTWTLSFGDGNATNGTTLPATVAHDYTAAGNFTLLYTLSDATSDVTYNATLNVTAGASAAANTATQQASGEWTAGAVSCPHVAQGAFEGESAGDLATGADVTWGYFEVDAATWGAQWTVTATSDTGALVELDFWDTGGAYMEYTSGEYGTPFSGTVPEDAGFAFVFPCGAGPGSFTYTAAFA